MINTDGSEGEIIGPFGKTGKFKVHFAEGTQTESNKGELVLRFKKFIFDKQRKLDQ